MPFIVGAEKLVGFFESPGGKDWQGRTLAQIVAKSDGWLERTHNYIQNLFPLPEESSSAQLLFVVDHPAFEAFRSRPELQDRLRLAFVRMLRFYAFEWADFPSRGIVVQRAAHFELIMTRWASKGNHNYLRITRILRSLRVLGLEEDALAFYRALQEVIRMYPSRFTMDTIVYWRRAMTNPLHLAPHVRVTDGVRGIAWLRAFEEAEERKRQEQAAEKSALGEGFVEVDRRETAGAEEWIVEQDRQDTSSVEAFEEVQEEEALDDDELEAVEGV
ncbi:MAG: hypothetical protein M1832_005161 [Thelocarpon impressellum]|nr:MAG: hypothetical protein M1832_005161 [Thelocarpon impressellum]